MRRSTVLAVALVAALLLGACGNDTKADSTGSNDPNTVDVLTAPSLKNLVTKVLAAYKKDHPGTQFHVFTQDQPAITKSVDEKKADVAVLPDLWLSQLTTQLTPRSFGRNLAVIAVATGNPHNIADLSVFAAGSGLRTHVSGVRSGFGDFMQPVLDKAGVVPDPASVAYGGEDQALQDVANGNLDAELMFRGEVTVPAGVTLLDVAPEQNLIFDFSYVVTGQSASTTAFVTFLESDRARQVLTENGYLP